MKYLICNLKNKLSYDEVKQYVLDLEKIDTEKVNFIVCPSLPFLYNFSKYTLGSQDISAYDCCLTGEVSAYQLKSLFVEYVIIGHMERRNLCKETKEILREKIQNANKHSLKIIYCIKGNEKDLESAKKEIEEDLSFVKQYLKEDTILAYEPTWAIGQELNLDFDYMQTIINYIKKLVDNDVVYGGSVNDKNVDNLLKIDKLDGFLISNSALNYKVLQNIICKMS